MSADHDDLVGLAATGNFADDVVRRGLAVHAAIERDAHARGRERDQPRELVGIGNRECGGWNRRQTGVEARVAGMRIAVRVGAGGSHQVGDRAPARIAADGPRLRTRLPEP